MGFGSKDIGKKRIYVYSSDDNLFIFFGPILINFYLYSYHHHQKSTRTKPDEDAARVGPEPDQTSRTPDPADREGEEGSTDQNNSPPGPVEPLLRKRACSVGGVSENKMTDFLIRETPVVVEDDEDEDEDEDV